MMKSALEEIWRTGGCLCPNNLVRWNTYGVGYIRWNSASFSLYYMRGTRRAPLPRRSFVIEYYDRPADQPITGEKINA
jgi:hypothetical protein